MIFSISLVVACLYLLALFKNIFLDFFSNLSIRVFTRLFIHKINNDMFVPVYYKSRVQFIPLTYLDNHDVKYIPDVKSTSIASMCLGILEDFELRCVSSERVMLLKNNKLKEFTCIGN